MEYGQLTVETLDDVAPRLRLFTNDLIKRLQACNLEIKTTTVYLLNSTNHPIEVPCAANRVTIQMNFDATMPVWAEEPRARIYFSFNGGRRFYYSERGRYIQTAKFPMARVLKRFLTQIRLEERRHQTQSGKEDKASKAQQAFETLSRDLGIPIGEPNTIHKNNLRIKCLSRTPSQVIIMLTVSHAEAIEIVSKYMKT